MYDVGSKKARVQENFLNKQIVNQPFIGALIDFNLAFLMSIVVEIT